MSSTQHVQHDVSSGGVCWRAQSGGGGPEVVLIQTRADRWQLPKGGIERGETREQAARREVREETGIDGEVLEHLETIDYYFTAGTKRQRRRKSVHLFLLRALSGDVSQHDDEALEARWFPIDEAIERLTFANERAVVEKAKARIAAGGAPTAS